MASCAAPSAVAGGVASKQSNFTSGGKSVQAPRRAALTKPTRSRNVVVAATGPEVRDQPSQLVIVSSRS
jgi:hypothetical protein